jgi:hypothetical protein
VSLKPQDVCVLLKIVALERTPWSYGQLAYELGMSASEVHAGVKRASEASLMRLDDGWGYPDLHALEEFLVHGLKYVFTPVRGGLTLGMPTAQGAPPLSLLVAQGDEPPPVWPDPEGGVRGVEFSPLYKSVPQAAKRDPKLYELLSLVDAVRGGTRAVREQAERELRARLAEREPVGREPTPGEPTEESSAAASSASGDGKRGANGKEARLYSRRY